MNWAGCGWLWIGLLSPLQSNLQLNDCSHTRRIPDTKQRVFGSHLYGQPATRWTNVNIFNEFYSFNELPGRLMSQGAATAKLNRRQKMNKTKTFIFLLNEWAGGDQSVASWLCRSCNVGRDFIVHNLLISGFPQWNRHMLQPFDRPTLGVGLSMNITTSLAFTTRNLPVGLLSVSRFSLSLRLWIEGRVTRYVAISLIIHEQIESLNRSTPKLKLNYSVITWRHFHSKSLRWDFDLQVPPVGLGHGMDRFPRNFSEWNLPPEKMEDGAAPSDKSRSRTPDLMDHAIRTTWPDTLVRDTTFQDAYASPVQFNRYANEVVDWHSFRRNRFHRRCPSAVQHGSGFCESTLDRFTSEFKWNLIELTGGLPAEDPPWRSGLALRLHFHLGVDRMQIKQTGCCRLRSARWLRNSYTFHSFKI